jgi:SAM-dependent methyltransferase
MKNTPKKYWNKFYKLKNKIIAPSNFAKFIKKMINKKDVILDVGTGNGRDAFYLSKFSKIIYGIDKSDEAIKINKNRIKLKKIHNLFFFNLSAERINFFNTKKITLIYARFFLHAVNDKIEDKFFYNINKYFSKKIKIALEFRTTKDALIKKGRKISKNERITTHYRRFIDLKNLLKKIRKYKLKVIYKKMGTNLSKTSAENPYLCRLILKFND